MATLATIGPTMTTMVEIGIGPGLRTCPHAHPQVPGCDPEQQGKGQYQHQTTSTEVHIDPQTAVGQCPDLRRHGKTVCFKRPY